MQRRGAEVMQLSQLRTLIQFLSKYTFILSWRRPPSAIVPCNVFLNIGVLSRTQELLTKVHTLCVEIHDIKRTSQKQFIKNPFNGPDKGSHRMIGRCYKNPPHKEEEQDDKPDCSHMALASSFPSFPPTGSSDTRRHYAGEEASSPATYPSTLPSPPPPHAAPPDSSPPFADTSEPADGDRKGHKIEPCSAGIQRGNGLEGQSEGHIPSSCESPPEAQVWKDWEGVDGDKSGSVSSEDSEGESSPCPSTLSKVETKGNEKRGRKKSSAATTFRREQTHSVKAM